METKEVMVSGGEPLEYERLPELLALIKSSGLRVTLSTNALRFMELHRSIMPFIDDLGIPIDWPTPETNAIMRPLYSLNQFAAAAEALRTAQLEYPGVALTLRTVVSALNQKWIGDIPEALTNLGVDMSRLRWCLYQFDPMVLEPERARGMELSSEEFQTTCNRVKGQLNTEIVSRSLDNYLYFLINPNGDVATWVNDSSSRPSQLTLGNMLGNPYEVVINWDLVVSKVV
jgi:MoaA/NifB/PqqE/SkfB family radical SAM enzyme